MVVPLAHFVMLPATGLPLTETLPPPEGVAHVPSPRQKVDDDAEVPLARLVTGRLPVTPVDKGKPVALVRVTLVGVPRTGVTRVGEVASTLLPVPVLAMDDRTPPADVCTAPAVVSGVVMVPVNVGDALGAAPVTCETV